MSNITRATVSGMRCPKCSFTISKNTTICENCGSWVPLEDASDSSSQFFRMVFGRRLNEMAMHDIAFYLSIIPLLIGPPVAAIIISGVKILQDSSRLQMREWQKPLMIGAVNIILSLMVWKFAAVQLSDIVRDVLYWLRDFSNPSGMPRLTPV